MSKILFSLLVIVGLSSCFAPRYRYQSYHKKPTKREIRNAMKYSTSEYPMPTNINYHNTSY